ncbi:hypothetical protein T492DRAFT_1091940 [Pavlovales sp. CCMP2436]|nr:hypothetical protein T492DRAFT_1091940 [Pavlovales sp. CCMP2436]
MRPFMCLLRPYYIPSLSSGERNMDTRRPCGRILVNRIQYPSAQGLDRMSASSARMASASRANSRMRSESSELTTPDSRRKAICASPLTSFANSPNSGVTVTWSRRDVVAVVEVAVAVEAGAAAARKLEGATMSATWQWWPMPIFILCMARKAPDAGCVLSHQPAGAASCSRMHTSAMEVGPHIT